MNYRQMMYLDAVVRYGSINHAAKALEVSQPNLSRAINKLEEEIGHHLLKRDVKGVQLTREGRRFYNLSHDIVRKTMALNQVYQTDADRQTLTFQLATFPQHVTQVIVRELVGQFAEDDSYEMIVWNLGMKEFIQVVRQYKCEIGVVFLTPGESENYRKIIRENGLDYHEVSAIRPCVNVSRHNPLYNRQAVSVSELESYPMARYVEDEVSYLDYRTLDFTRFKKSVFFNSDEAIAIFVAQTDAFKIGYSWTRQEYEELGVRCIPLVDDIGLLYLGWVSRKNEGLSHMAARFVQLFEKRYRFE